MAAALVWAAGASCAYSASADDWMYRRSYYSHMPAAGDAARRPPTRSAYRPALRGSGFGFGARGGYRFNRVFLRSGQSTDLTVIQENWFDAVP